MKTFLILLISFLPWSSFGGPFVSGGMGLQLKCGDDTMSYQFEVMVQFGQAYGSLYQIVGDKVIEWPIDCKANKANGDEGFTCRSTDKTHLVNIYGAYPEQYGVVTVGQKQSEKLRCYQ